MGDRDFIDATAHSQDGIIRCFNAFDKAIGNRNENDVQHSTIANCSYTFFYCDHSCIASKPKRFIIVKKVANKFIEKFVQKAEKLKVCDPLSNDTDVGPLVNASDLKNIDSQVKDSVKEAAKILTGSEQTGSKGYFYKPTMLKNSHANTLSFMYQRITSIFTWIGLSSKKVTPPNV